MEPPKNKGFLQIFDQTQAQSVQNEFEAILFDFDYTLVDSSAAITECIGFAFRELGLPEASAGKAPQIIGLPLHEMFLRLVGADHVEKLEEFVHLYRRRADEVMESKTILFASVPETLEKLSKCGIVLGIVSTKGRFRIRPILEREKILQYFQVIVGGEDVSAYKPNPEGLLGAIRQLRSNRAHSLYVGDSIIDAETAMRANVPFVAVLSGETPKERFVNYPAYGFIHDLGELPAVVGCE
ncbi:MAG: HAD family hydrolase [Candidatus Abyssobacteria bacterium SURF_5]|uniref:phosphoglycolate phosphatase n=1 Tax=Abyssobacteria bacterium (strain SURF_5) TaxID=2093360 RepID=A0A3A4P5F9_ABYX5|nr:MAG: HAD family hydrolase [Candidatus Abyssubacteria bacterium SURF_5]